MSAPRRSARSNKGRHTQRETELAILLRDESGSDDEATPKKRHLQLGDDDDDVEYQETREKKPKMYDVMSSDDDEEEEEVEEVTRAVSAKGKQRKTTNENQPSPSQQNTVSDTGSDAAFKRLRDKVRANVAKALWNVLKQQLPADIPTEEGQSKDDVALNYALEMEAAIFRLFPAKDRHYTDKSRSTMTILKKASVISRLVDKSLSSDQLISLSPQEIDEDLKKYAEKVHQDAIKRLVLTNEENGQRIRRTHKGDEIVDDVSDDHKYESQDVSIVSKSVDHRRFSDTDKNDTVKAEITKEEVKPQEVTVNQEQLSYNVTALDDDTSEWKYQDESDGSDASGGNPLASESDSDDDFDKILGGPGPKAETKKETKQTSKEESHNAVSEPAPRASPSPSPAPSLPKKPAFSLPSKPLKSAMKKPHRLPPMLGTDIWQGPLTYPDLASFNCRFQFITHTSYYQPKTPLDVKLHNKAVNISKDLFAKPSFYVKGKLPFQTADGYLKQVSSANPMTKDFYVFKVVPLDNFSQYDKMNGYFLNQVKAGVLSAEPSFVKATYLISLNGRNVPPYLRSLQQFEDQTGLFIVAVVDKEYAPRNSYNPTDPTKPSVSISVPEDEEAHTDHQMQVPQHLRSEPYPKHPTGSVLDSILSKLGGSDTADPPPVQPFQPQPASQVMTNEQLSLLTSIVQQNPQAQSNPQEMVHILQQQRQNNGY